ncbi:MAG: hypothetical protein KDH19_10965 [Geminicoccaceae bacterium]|nr:hypothetical protein [Geminicoccaceae bacterium]
MLFSDAEANALLDDHASRATHLAVHSAYPGATGASEVSSARVAAGWGSAAARELDLSAAVSLSMPAGSTAAWVSRWSAISGGSFLGATPIGGSGSKEVQVDTTADTIVSEGHGFSNGDRVVFYNGTAPGGLTAGNEYFVVGSTADSFQVSASDGGAVINLTSDGDVGLLVDGIVTETFGNAGTMTISALTISI